MRIGIDLGGTKTEAIALADDGVASRRRRIPTPRGYAPALDAIAGLVADLESEIGGRCSVGVGIPGVVSRTTGLVKNANSTWLIGHPLQADLETRLGRPVRIANDANCFALSEAADGAGRDHDSVFGVILGTGVGGGIVVRRQILDGPNQIAGEWGHNPLPWMTDDERASAPACYCGKSGCIETFLSGPGLEGDYARHAGSACTGRQIVEAAAAGEAQAAEALRRYEDRLARALAGVINILDPDAVVLGGGMSNLPGLAGAVSALLPRYVFSDSVLTKVLPNVHGDSSGVRGAAWLWPGAGPGPASLLLSP
jgi:fructokinase